MERENFEQDRVERQTQQNKNQRLGAKFDRFAKEKGYRNTNDGLFAWHRGMPDLPLLAVTAILVAFGLVILFSASYGYGLTKFDDGYYYIRQQSRGVIAGLFLAALFYFVNYKKIVQSKVLFLLWMFGMGILVLCWVPGIGTSEGINSAHRWLKVPIFGSFQPSEMSKFIILVVEAGVLSVIPPKKFRDKPMMVLLVLLLAAPYILLLFLQPNFSVLLITAVSFCIVLFISGITLPEMLTLAVVGLIVAIPAMMSRGYRASRLTSYIDQISGGTGNDQVTDAIYAIGSGGIFGTGLGKSRMKHDFLSYGESDFILAIIGEELGLIGLLILLGLYITLIWRGYLIAMRANDRFAALAATGIVTLIGVQTFVHFFVSLGVFPTTGVTLPFISHGSSSMMCFMGAVGFLLNISRGQTRPEPTEKGYR